MLTYLLMNDVLIVSYGAIILSICECHFLINSGVVFVVLVCNTDLLPAND